MILYILLTMVTMLVATKIVSLQKENINVQEKSVVNRICLAGLFTLLFLPAVLRINTGNDYPTYIERFHDIYRHNYVVTEKGFNAVVTFIYWFCNSENYLVVFGVFAALTIFIFLMAMYKQSADFKMTFYMYMTFGLYFQCYNTVRYYFALSIVFFAMRYAIKKDYIKFLLLVLVAMLFHKTSIAVIPIYILSGIKWKKWALPVITAFSLTGIIFKSQYMALFLRLYPSYLEEEEYINAGGLSLPNIIRCFLVLCVCIYFYKDAIKDNDENRFYFYLNYAGFLAYTFFYFVPFVSRLGYYMNICHILMFPSMIKCIKDEKKKKYFTIGVYVVGAAYFLWFLWFKANDPEIKILPYHTWLFNDVLFDALDK